ncbi:MAG: DUF3829 domain-containing protein [Ahniella sp.]|nr:DUF3829 domain-containing protein [Ahniella sp.]
MVHGLYALRDPADCRKEILAAAELPPEDPELEGRRCGIHQRAGDGATVVDEANQYYELSEWQDDGMRKGKDLHPRLVTAYEAFAQADAALRGRVTILRDAVGERWLARLAADPEQRSVYLVENMYLAAKKLLDQSEGIGSKSFQREPFTAALSRFETAWKDYDTFRKAHPDHTDSVIKDSMVAHSSFELLKSAKSMARQELKGFRFDEGERMLIEANAPQMVEGHPAQLVDRYNQFITFMNSARR